MEFDPLILNNVISGLMLAAIIWVGSSINTLRDTVGELATALAVVETQNSYLDREVLKLERDITTHLSRQQAAPVGRPTVAG